MFPFVQGEDPFTNETVDPEIEGDDNLGGEDKEETPEEVAAEVLAEVITAAVRAVDGEGVPAGESSEVLAEGQVPVGATEASSDVHTEQLLEEQTSCGTASEKGNTEAEAGSEAMVLAAGAENALTVDVPAPAAVESEVGHNAEAKDNIHAE